LSLESRTQRFLGPKNRLTERELTWLTDLDHVTQEALVAIDGRGDLVAVARYAAAREPGSAEIAVVVADPWQRRGLGSALTAEVIERARANCFTRLTASTLGDNLAARSLLARLGFRVASVANGVVSYTRRLTAPCRRVA
jgi:ribosomal protein S18 acetylase RimI-like enzyme